MELGQGGRQSSVTNPRIFMARCKGSDCQDIKVEVSAKSGSPYILYRKYKVEEGATYKMAPIIVSIAMQHETKFALI